MGTFVDWMLWLLLLLPLRHAALVIHAAALVIRFRRHNVHVSQSSRLALLPSAFASSTDVSTAQYLGQLTVAPVRHHQLDPVIIGLDCIRSIVRRTCGD